MQDSDYELDLDETSHNISPSSELIALLFVAREPLSEKKLSELIGSPIQDLIQNLNQTWRLENYPLQILKRSEGYILTVRTSYQSVIDKLYKGPTKERLSGASLEVLAILHHKGALPRSEIDQIRGVDSLPILQSLLDKELVETERHPEKKIPLYRLTKTFLSHLQETEEAAPPLPVSPEYLLKPGISP